MRIAICDDEKSIRDDIESRIKLLFPEYEVVKYREGDSLLADKVCADILFLDIQIPGKNGIEVARLLRARKSNIIIIFITAAEEYVFSAFDVNAFHYLIKPLDKVKFYEVLQKAVKHVQRMEKSGGGAAGQKKTIMIHVGAVHTNVVCDDILYAEVYNRKILLHTKQEDFEYYGKLSELEGMVGEGFFRPHRAFLVNMACISSYDSKSIYLMDGDEIPIAKAKHAEFVKVYLAYHVERKKEGR